MRKLWLKWQYGQGEHFGCQGMGDAKSVLFLRHDRLGDLAVMWPFIRLMQKHFPGARFHILVSEVNASLLACEDWIIRHEVAYGDKSSRLMFHVLDGMRGQIDLAVDPFFSRWGRVLKLLKRVNPKCIIGFEKENRYGLSVKDLGYHIATEVSHDEGATLSDAFRQLYADLTGEQLSRSEYYQAGHITTGKYGETAQSWLKANDLYGKNYVLLNVSGYGDYKCMQPDTVQKLARAIYQTHNIPVVVVAAPERMAAIRPYIAQEKGIHLIWPSSHILEVVALIHHATAVISVDTSIVHLSELAGKPLLGFYIREKMVDRLFLPSLLSSHYVEVSRVDQWGEPDIRQVISYVHNFMQVVCP